MICHPKKSDKPVLLQIWKDIFCDTDEYISFYFNRIYKEQNCVVKIIDGKIVGTIYFSEFELKCDGSISTAYYICGIAVLEQYRNAGIMRCLLDEAINIVKKRGATSCFLIPANESLYGLYNKLGFSENVFLYTKEFLYEQIEEARGIEISKVPIFQKYKEVVQGIDYILLKSKKDFDNVIEEFSLFGGDYLVFSDGYCFFYIKDDIITVSECFINSENVDALIWYFKENFSFKSLVFKSHLPLGIKQRAGVSMSLTEKVLPNIYMNMMLN